MEKKVEGVILVQDNTIKAVLDDDFENLLKKLQVYDLVAAGSATCFFCQAPVSFQNISMVFPDNKQVCFCCDKPECVEKMLEWGVRK